MTQSLERAVIANAKLLRERNGLRRELDQAQDLIEEQAATITELRRRVRDHEHPDNEAARTLEHRAWLKAVHA